MTDPIIDKLNHTCNCVGCRCERRKADELQRELVIAEARVAELRHAIESFATSAHLAIHMDALGLKENQQ